MKTMMLATAAVLALGVGSAFAGEGDGTGCQHLLHRVARRGCPGTEPAGAERGRPEPDGGAPTAAFVTNHSSGTWLFPPYQGNG